MKYINLFCLLVLSQFAKSEDQMTFDKLFLESSDSIIHIRVIEAQEQSFDIDGELEMCGVNYNARVLRSIKSAKEERTIEFSSVYPLVVSEEYLLFLGKAPSASGLVIELSGKFEEEMLTCEKKLKEIKVNDGEFFLVKDYPYDLIGSWVEFSGLTYLGEEKEKPCLYQEGNCNFVPLSKVLDQINRTFSAPGQSR